MKNVFIVLLLFYLNTNLFAQCSSKDIIGVWQYENSEIGSAWLDTYQFFSDGKFVFNLSQYDEIKRIIAIKGHYRIFNDTIYFKIEYTTELTGGYIVRDNLTKIHGSWALFGNLRKEDIRQPEMGEEYATIKFCKEEIGAYYVLIDGRKFFRIKNDPSEY